jgi:hypothetical protein
MKSYLELDAAGLDLSSFNMMAASDGNRDMDAQFILPIDEDVRIENNTEEGEALTVTSPAQSTTSHLHQGTIQFSMQTGGVVLSPDNDRATDNQQGGNKRTKCCAVCVWNYCTQRHTCPGTGSRAWCRCHHSRTPPSKEVRNISEPKIRAFLLETASLSQNEREDLLTQEKDMQRVGGS